MDGSFSFSLEDKYTSDDGRIYVTGVQALVRLPLVQHRRDKAAGLDTAGFISGYRGSPLGGYDTALWQAQQHLDAHQVTFQSGVNEDMAATACWGTQQLGISEPSKHDGVFAIWYGKGPGVDRSGDPIKHGNMAGSSKHGGVLVLAGDDHMAKSSTTAHQSEQALIAAMIPILNPANVQEILDFGLAGIALSRYSGCWVGLKCVADTVESAASVDGSLDRMRLSEPGDFRIPPDGVHFRWPDGAVAKEARHVDVKLKAAQAFVRWNKLDRQTHASRTKRLGIVATGKAWTDVCQAFEELGLTDRQVADLGINVFKVAMSWPLVPEPVRDFCAGHQEILVVEEKRNIIEDQLARVLFDLPDGQRPRLVGKRDEKGRALVPESGQLTGTLLARIIAGRFLDEERQSCLNDALSALSRRTTAEGRNADLGERKPWFCAGCPHNTSTKVPEGSSALAGIGCHTLSVYMDRSVGAYTHMGGEGGTWVGMAPFTTTGHMFQNMGDGTYYHSGLLAIRAAVRAGVNITYKILYNDAVALTGGQTVEGDLTPADITRQLRAEGVRRIQVVTDEPEKYPEDTPFAEGVEVHERHELDRLQRELREVPGITAIVYDQTCAAEKRRRRKRGTFPDPDRRMFINELACEGCGDCGETSNCVAVRPVETPFGRKRAIDQSSCNKDFTCLDGFCPSFVTVRGGTLRKAAKPETASGDDPAAGLPLPAIAGFDVSCNVLLGGIGGTGVITVGALLGVAAHLDGLAVSVLDQTGLAQKNGAVGSHVRIARSVGHLAATRIGAGMTDVLLGFDMITAASQEMISTLSRDRSHAVVNSHLVPLASFAEQPDMSIDGGGYRDAISAQIGAERATMLNTTHLAERIMGDSIMSNIFMVGFALQKGYLPVSPGALQQAIRLNGVAVEANLRALAWGRVAAEDLSLVLELAGGEGDTQPPETVDQIVERRVKSLTAYQNAGFAETYGSAVARVRHAEAAIVPGRTDLTEAVARSLYKLMAVKDEYEVARLFTDGRFEAKLREQFEGDFKIAFNFAPPMFAKIDPVTGRPEKMAYPAPWYFALRLLAKLRGLRGTALDIFRYSKDRRLERRLLSAYQETLEDILSNLNAANYETAVELAALPQSIRGYGPVKDTHAEAAREKAKTLRESFHQTRAEAEAAE